MPLPSSRSSRAYGSGGAGPPPARRPGGKRRCVSRRQRLVRVWVCRLTSHASMLLPRASIAVPWPCRLWGCLFSAGAERVTGEMAPAAAASPSSSRQSSSGMPLTRDSWREIYHPGYFSCSSPSDLVTPGGGFTERVMISQAFFHSIKCYPFPGQHHRCTQHPRQPTGSRTGIHHRLP